MDFVEVSALSGTQKAIAEISFISLNVFKTQRVKAACFPECFISPLLLVALQVSEKDQHLKS